MATYNENEKERILSFPIPSILSHFGKRTDHVRQMYFSPFRDERTPSFCVKESSNLWMDFGSGEGGNVLTLVSRLAGIPLSEAWDYIANLDPGMVVLDTPAGISRETSHSTKIIIDRVRDTFSSRNLVSYAESRGIPRHILEFYCKQVTYHVESNRMYSWTAIGFPASDGWVLRQSTDGRFAKRCTGSCCTLLSVSGNPVPVASCDRVEVFEGFFDFLSWLVMKERTKPFSDICVLNSVNNLSRGLEFIVSHSQVSCWLDNDEAGHAAFERIRESCPGARDHYQELGDCKDVNELLQQRRKAIVNHNSITSNSVSLKHK